MPIIANGSIVIIDSKNTYNHNSNDDYMMMKKIHHRKPRELPHGSIIKVSKQHIKQNME